MNVYDDPDRARSYATLEFPGTYYVAFRDLPALFAEHVRGDHALDFGCGTGRSTRFLQSLSFTTVGIDIAADMVDLARAADPRGTYLVVPDGDLTPLGQARFDLILSAFAFDNIRGADHRAHLLRTLAGHLTPNGRAVLLASTPEIYWHEWASFTTAGFPENRAAKSGDEVRIVMTDVADRRPVIDTIWFDADYQAIVAAAGLEVVACHHPLGHDGDPVAWVTETSVAPWVIYVLAARPRS